MKKTVVSIGEILWDVLPEGKKAGGSSMNVALNLHKQGINSLFISAMGDDENGRQLIKFLNDLQYPTDLIQVNVLPTSTVLVELDKQQQATYAIAEPVAWDKIELTAELISTVKHADAMVYCSLTCRNETSRNTILTLLTHAKIKIFDLNLRPPFYTIDTLKSLLQSADILKVNEHELAYLKNELQLKGSSEEELLKQLGNVFNIQIVCLTMGEKGAFAWHKNKIFGHSGYAVEVADTVGAGDAFLATFVASYLNGYAMEEVLDRACKIGAFVASQNGANPNYGVDILE
jgi:fructokinase